MTLPADCPTVLYLHGGGLHLYAMVTATFHAEPGHALQLPLFALDYRLTPEHPYPAQLDDAISAYRYLAGARHGAAENRHRRRFGRRPTGVEHAGAPAELGPPQPAIGIAL